MTTSSLVTVTVLCTVYNAGEFVQAAIDSVLGQTYEDWELVVMDDGSTDPLVSRALWALDERDDRRVRVVAFSPSVDDRRASCRYATLMNWGGRHTTGKLVTYLAGDDYYLPDRLERMVATIRDGHDVVYGGQVLLNGNGDQIGERGTVGVLDDAFHRVDLNSVMHTRKAFRQVGGWPTSPDIWRNADAHFWRRLTDAGYRFVPVAGGPTDVKRYREDSVSARVIRGETPWI